jgi:hypothetical protein
VGLLICSPARLESLQQWRVGDPFIDPSSSFPLGLYFAKEEQKKEDMA